MYQLSIVHASVATVLHKYIHHLPRVLESSHRLTSSKGHEAGDLCAHLLVEKECVQFIRELQLKK